MPLPLVSTVLKEVSEKKTTKEKVDHLLYHRGNKVMISLLKYVFDPRVEFDLPEGAPPYTEDKVLESNESGLYGRFRSFYIFLKDGSPGLTQPKREMLFIELLESIHPDEAKLIIAVKDKKLPYKGITAKTVEKAFPGLIDS